MKGLFLTILLIVLILVTISEAQEVEVQLQVSELTINIGETKSINVTVKNFQDKKDIFSLLVWPPLVPRFGIYTDIQPRIELEPNSKVETPVTFIVPECTIEGNLEFKITAISLTNVAINDTKTLILRVKGEGLTCITSIETNRIFNPGEKVKIEVSVSNFAEGGEFVLEVMVKKDGKIEKSFLDEIKLGSRDTKKLEYNYVLDEHALAGSYDVNALLKKDEKVISSRATKFEVRAIENLDYSHSTKNLVILQTGSIKIKNLGNSLSQPTTQNLVTPWFMKVFFYSPTKPLEESMTDNQVTYTWEVPSLEPLGEYEIKYEFRFWPVWVGVAIAIVLILFAYLHFYTIRVIKRTKPVGVLNVGREIPISISILNNSPSELRDILVRDLVPPIVSVVERFETLKPVKRKIKEGTELNWRISSLKPGEEVILAYRIKPIVDIMGTLKLPKAWVRFISKGREKKILVSKPIVIGA
ncbi:MAG: hypothetical protein QMD14_01955 [Candidatus Aenigmarchaeota archaeon]|nr:hypothetical protein [Candidatus Aenigmarchaeota archaeon]